MLIACCDDHSINTYNLKSGAKVLPPIIIEDLVASLCLSEKGYCMVLTRTGLLHMWDLEKCTNVINRASIRSLLSRKGKSLKMGMVKSLIVPPEKECINNIFYQFFESKIALIETDAFSFIQLMFLLMYCMLQFYFYKQISFYNNPYIQLLDNVIIHNVLSFLFFFIRN